jgi:hypothetical protein
VNPSATARLHRLRDTAPDAVRLATLLSLAVRIEPPLLRAVRVAAGLGVAVESDLWLSPVVASAGPRGICLDPAVADLLRVDLAGRPGQRELAWDLVRRHHRDAAWSFRLEEQINYLSTYGDGRLDEIEELLAAALAELRRTSERDRAAAVGIARWLLAALARLPGIARGTPAAAVAGVAAGVHLDGRLHGLAGVEPDDRDWLAWLLDFVPTVEVWVQRRTNALRFGAEGRHAVRLTLPATDPLAVTVLAGDEVVPVRLYPGEEVAVPVPPGPVEVRALNGRRVLLAPATTGQDFFVNRVYEIESFRKLLLNRDGPRVLLLAGEPGIGKTALMRRFVDICRQLEFGDVVMVPLATHHKLDVADLVALLRGELTQLDPALSILATDLESASSTARLVETFARDLARYTRRRQVAIFIDDLDVAGAPGVELVSALVRIVERSLGRLVVVVAGGPATIESARLETSRGVIATLELRPDLSDADTAEFLRAYGLDERATETLMRALRDMGRRTPREIIQFVDAWRRSTDPGQRTEPA